MISQLNLETIFLFQGSLQIFDHVGKKQKFLKNNKTIKKFLLDCNWRILTIFTIK